MNKNNFFIKIIKLNFAILFWPITLVYFLIKYSSKNTKNDFNEDIELSKQPSFSPQKTETKNTKLNLPISVSSPIQFTTDECPNCHTKLEKVPTRKTKCKSCSKEFYVRTHYLTKEKILLSESQKKKYEIQSTEYYFEKDWIRKVTDIGITESDIEENRKELREKWGPGHPSFRDLMWRTFNKQVMNLVQNKAPFYEFKMLYFNWGLFAFEIDTDPTNLLKQSHKFELMELKNHGVKKVTVLCGQGCESCKKNANKEFNIDNLLPEQDILPCKGCIEKLGHPERKFSWCRCMFQPKIEF
ncbi:MAG: hypothetical protein AAGU06_03715 [Candidatus Shapirobacteria bacterium]